MLPAKRKDPDQPVPLVLAPNEFEAQVIAEALNAEGIFATVMGSHGQWLGAGSPFSSVNVMVRRAQRMEALGVLRRIRAEAKDMPLPPDAEGVPQYAFDDEGRCIVCSYDLTGLHNTLVCPECGTNFADDAHVFHARAGGSVIAPAFVRFLAAALVALVLGATLLAILNGKNWDPF